MIKNSMSSEQKIGDLRLEIIELQKKIEEKKKEQERLIKVEFEVEEKVDSALNALEKSILEIKRIDPEAIADFKERVLSVFQTNSTNSIFNTHPTHAVTMEEILKDEEEEDVADPIKGVEDYAVWVTRRCTLCWGYEIESVENIKTGFLSRVNQVDGYSYDDPDLIKIVETPAEKAGYEFYKTCDLKHKLSNCSTYASKTPCSTMLLSLLASYVRCT